MLFARVCLAMKLMRTTLARMHTNTYKHKRARTLWRWHRWRRWKWFVKQHVTWCSAVLRYGRHSTQPTCFRSPFHGTRLSLRSCTELIVGVVVVGVVPHGLFSRTDYYLCRRAPHVGACGAAILGGVCLCLCVSVYGLCSVWTHCILERRRCQRRRQQRRREQMKHALTPPPPPPRRYVVRVLCRRFVLRSRATRNYHWMTIIVRAGDAMSVRLFAYVCQLCGSMCVCSIALFVCVSAVYAHAPLLLWLLVAPI